MSTRKRQSSSPILPRRVARRAAELGILLRGPYQEIVRRIADELGDAGFDDIRPAHTAVFQHIKAEGSRLSELAQAAQITKQSMGYLVDYLETRGYVERRADPSDRRASLIFLTERGWDQIRAALAIIAGIEEEWARSLGTRDMEELRKHLARLNQTIGQAVSDRDQ